MKLEYQSPLTEVEIIKLEANLLASMHDSGNGTGDVVFSYDDDFIFA